MSPDYSKDKFVFFKKATAKRKLGATEKLLIGVCGLFLVGVQHKDVQNFTAASQYLQVKTATLYLNSAKVSSEDSQEKLTKFLSLPNATYDDLDSSLEIIKANTHLPKYLYSYTLDKIQRDNSLLYDKNMKELRYSYGAVEYPGITRLFVSDSMVEKNRSKFYELSQTYKTNYEIFEQKVNSISKEKK